MSVSDTLQTVEGLLWEFEPLSLQELGLAALMDRLDTKYVFTIDHLPAMLDAVRDDYRVLEVVGVRAHHYATTYYDTPDLAMYLAHHNGARSRYKVRTRAYLDSQICFLEVKHKTNRERMIKSRMAVPVDVSLNEPAAAAFVRQKTPYTVDNLIQTAWNRFQRITLVHRRYPERITIDVNLRFGRDDQENSPGIVIAEMKQLKFNSQSDFVRQMSAVHVQPMGFSKYCEAIVTCTANVKYNRFKPRQLKVARLLRESHLS